MCALSRLLSSSINYFPLLYFALPHVVALRVRGDNACKALIIVPVIRTQQILVVNFPGDLFSSRTDSRDCDWQML